MTEREQWNALCSMVGKRAAYDIAHAGEFDARPFWSEQSDPHERLGRYAWRAWIDATCDPSVKRINHGEA